MADVYEMTVSQATTGIALSKKNARRLASDALALLKAGSSMASVYGQWHLAVEEVGKSAILENCLANVGHNGVVQVPKCIFQSAHQRKFADGLARLPATSSSGFGLAVTVNRNTSVAPMTFTDPYGSGGSVSVPGLTTGQFEDMNPIIKPSHELRLRLLYVDFDQSQWFEPEAELRAAEIRAKISISRADLSQAIEELLSCVS